MKLRIELEGDSHHDQVTVELDGATIMIGWNDERIAVDRDELLKAIKLLSEVVDGNLPEEA